MSKLAKLIGVVLLLGSVTAYGGFAVAIAPAQVLNPGPGAKDPNYPPALYEIILIHSGRALALPWGLL
jgi:hypothetical protein